MDDSKSEWEGRERESCAAPREEFACNPAAMSSQVLISKFPPAKDS